MVDRCECCEAEAVLETRRRGGIVLDLCSRCCKRDVIGLLRSAA